MIVDDTRAQTAPVKRSASMSEEELDLLVEATANEYTRRWNEAASDEEREAVESELFGRTDIVALGAVLMIAYGPSPEWQPE